MFLQPLGAQEQEEGPLPMFIEPGSLSAPEGETETGEPLEEEAESSGEQPEFQADPILPPLLDSGRRVRGIVDLSSGINYTTYRFHVPPEAMRVVISLQNAQGDLDLFVRHGADIVDYAMVDAKAISDDYNETLVLSRFGDEGLYDGEYYLDVAYQRERPPRHNGRYMDQIGFSLMVEYKSVPVAERISSGDEISGILKPDEGMMKLYAVRTASWDSSLRIDISDTTGDIDLFIAYDNPGLTPENAEYRSESLLGRESIVIDRDSSPSFRTGTYHVLVVDQVADKFPVAFTMKSSKEASPPEDLLVLSPIPDPDDPVQHAVGATVEVIGKQGRGSGSLVSSDGYLLTNWHVVRDAENKPSGDVYIAATLNQHIPPQEMFRGEVVRYDEELDLALVKINSGRYGQPIPANYRFPFFRLGDANRLRLGQPLSILGYPSNGGAGSRVPVTLTRGILSGFEKTPIGTYIKTDAEISFGNSGGAVFDAFGELLGIPVSIYSDGEGKLAFILPVTMVPPSWLKIIDGSH
jgi:S1-C subfamily serine protease